MSGIHTTNVHDMVSANDGLCTPMRNGRAGLYRRTAGGAGVPLDNAELQSLMLNPLSFADIATSPENPSLLYSVGMTDGIARA